MLQQEPHHVLLPVLTRREERRPRVLVHLVHLGAPPNQELRRLDRVLFAGHVERRPPVVVAGRVVRTLVKEQLRDLRERGNLAGEVERGCTVRVLPIRVPALLELLPHGRGRPVQDSGVERRALVHDGSHRSNSFYLRKTSTFWLSLSILLSIKRAWAGALVWPRVPASGARPPSIEPAWVRPPPAPHRRRPNSRAARTRASPAGTPLEEQHFFMRRLRFCTSPLVLRSSRLVSSRRLLAVQSSRPQGLCLAVAGQH